MTWSCAPALNLLLSAAAACCWLSMPLLSTPLLSTPLLSMRSCRYVCD
jgi:hypothetical protein